MDGILNTLPRRRIGSFGDAKDYLNQTEYTLGFWKTIYSSPRVKSIVANNTYFGELNHPNAEYRIRDIDLAKVALRAKNIIFVDLVGKQLAHLNVDTGDWVEDVSGIDYKDISGEVIADIDILDTPMGQILNTYVKSGSNIGFSTRANGETKRVNGKRIVDVNDYKLIGLDAVQVPSKTNARIIDESAEHDVLIDNMIETVNNIVKSSSIDEEHVKIIEDYVQKSGMDEVYDSVFGDGDIVIKKRDLKNLSIGTSEKPNLDLSVDIKNNIRKVIESLVSKNKELTKRIELKNDSDEGNDQSFEERNDLLEEISKFDSVIESKDTEISDLSDRVDLLKDLVVNTTREIVNKYIPKIQTDSEIENIANELILKGLPITAQNIRNIHLNLIPSGKGLPRNIVNNSIDNSIEGSIENVKKLLKR